MNMTQRRKVAELISHRVDKFKTNQHIVFQRLRKRERDKFDASPPSKVADAVDAINQAVKTITKANAVLKAAGYSDKTVGYNFEDVIDVYIKEKNRPDSKVDEPNFDDLDEKIEALELRLWIAGDLEAEVLMTELEGLLK